VTAALYTKKKKYYISIHKIDKVMAHQNSDLHNKGLNCMVAIRINLIKMLSVSQSDLVRILQIVDEGTDKFVGTERSQEETIEIISDVATEIEKIWRESNDGSFNDKWGECSRDPLLEFFRQTSTQANSPAPKGASTPEREGIMMAANAPLNGSPSYDAHSAEVGQLGPKQTEEDCELDQGDGDHRRLKLTNLSEYMRRMEIRKQEERETQTKAQDAYEDEEAEEDFDPTDSSPPVEKPPTKDNYTTLRF
jgi:hypothetical protein